MRHMVNGRIVEVKILPGRLVASDDLRQAGGVADDRQLIDQSPDGSNRIINPGEILNLPPDQFFEDAPLHERGFSAAANQSPLLLTN